MKLSLNFQFVLRWLITAGLLTYIIVNNNPGQILQTLRHINPGYAVAVWVTHILVFSLIAIRWQTIAEKFSITALFADYLKATWVGALFAQIGPSLLFSEVARFQTLRKHGKRHNIICSQIVDRLSGQISLLLISLFCLPLYMPVLSAIVPEINSKINIGFFLFVVIGLFCALLLRLPTLERLIRVRQIMRILKPLPCQLHYFVSLFIQLLLIAGFYLAACAVGQPIDSLMFLTLTPLLFAGLTFFPISVADWGTREVAAVILFSQMGLTNEYIVAVSLVFGATYTLAAALGGLFFLLPDKD